MWRTTHSRTSPFCQRGLYTSLHHNISALTASHTCQCSASLNIAWRQTSEAHYNAHLHLYTSCTPHIYIITSVYSAHNDVCSHHQGHLCLQPLDETRKLEYTCSSTGRIQALGMVIEKGYEIPEEDREKVGTRAHGENTIIVIFKYVLTCCRWLW